MPSSSTLSLNPASLTDVQQSGMPADFSWVGASMHLKPDEVMRVLQDVACCAPGSSIAFDYVRTAFQPRMLEHMLGHFGFRHIEHGAAGADMDVCTIKAAL